MSKIGFQLCVTAIHVNGIPLNETATPATDTTMDVIKKTVVFMLVRNFFSPETQASVPALLLGLTLKLSYTRLATLEKQNGPSPALRCDMLGACISQLW